MLMDRQADVAELGLPDQKEKKRPLWGKKKKKKIWLQGTGGTVLWPLGRHLLHSTRIVPKTMKTAIT